MTLRLAARLIFAGLALSAAACSPDTTVDKRDRSGPFVIATNPANGDKDIDIRPDIEVQFSEAILVVKKLSPTKIEEFDYSAFRVTDPKGAEVKGFITFNNDTIVFRASNPLAYATKYTVTITNGVKDLFGNRGKPHTFSFTTVADTVAPNAPYGLGYPTLSNKTSVTLTGAKDPGSTVRINGKDAGIKAATELFSTTLTLVDGVNNFTLTAVDEAGNESEESAIAITLDRVPPAPLATCNTTGLAFDDGAACWNPPATIYWNNRNLALAAEWTPGPGETAYFTLGAAYTPPFTNPKIRYDTIRPEQFAGQSVPLKAYTLDQAGNTTVSFERTFVFDEVAELSARNGAAAITTTTPSLSLTFDKEAGAQFFAALDHQRAASCGTALTACTVALSGLADGVHTFTATVTDVAKNETRLVKTITVDTRAPTAFTLPLDGGNAPVQPVFHVFADEPVTSGRLWVGGQSLAPATDTASGGMHYSYSLPSALAAATYPATVTLADAAGNSKTLAWTFTTGGAFASPPATYATPAPVGTLRDGVFTVGGLPAAALNVVRYTAGGVKNVSAYAVTTATAVTATTDALSVLQGEVRTYDNAGTYTTAALPVFNPFYPGAPALSGAFNPVSMSYGSAGFFDAPASGFVWLSENGYAYRVDGGTPAAFVLCSVPSPADEVPLVQLARPWAVTGLPCGVRAVDLSQLGATPTTLWSPANETTFGSAVTAARFFGDSNLQMAVGSPLGAGSLYVYAATTATAPTLVLQGDAAATTGRFGDAAAFANGYFTGKRTLAVLASFESAIYFFDDAIYPERLQNPAPLYRGRWPWPVLCASGFLREELINAGDLDGDGSEDFAAAAFCDGTSPNTMTLAVFYGGAGAAAGGPAVQTASIALPLQNASFVRPRLMAAGDLDGDGRDDLVVADRTNGAAVRVFHGTAGGPLREGLVTPEVVSTAVTWLLGGVMDADQDGNPDLILGRSDQVALTLRTLP